MCHAFEVKGLTEPPPGHPHAPAATPARPPCRRSPAPGCRDSGRPRSQRRTGPRAEHARHRGSHGRARDPHLPADVGRQALQQRGVEVVRHGEDRGAARCPPPRGPRAGPVRTGGAPLDRRAVSKYPSSSISRSAYKAQPSPWPETNSTRRWNLESRSRCSIEYATCRWWPGTASWYQTESSHHCRNTDWPNTGNQVRARPAEVLAR